MEANGITCAESGEPLASLWTAQIFTSKNWWRWLLLSY